MKKILVAEDDARNRELIREILVAWGYAVIEAQDGREALQKAQETLPHLILLDIQMPGMDGFSVLQELRQDPHFAAIPVVAVTAYAMQGDREKALDAGFDAYITKPIETKTLRAQIEKLFS